MQVISFAWGVLSLIGMIIAFFPCLGALNWLNVPFSAFGLIVSIISYLFSKKRYRVGSLTGIIFCSVAIIVGLIRLALGFGIL